MSISREAKMKKKPNLWRFWAKSLGEKGSKCDRESDKIALIRTIIFMTYLITNIFICAGVIRHWNDAHPVSQVAQGCSKIP